MAVDAALRRLGGVDRLAQQQRAGCSIRNLVNADRPPTDGRTATRVAQVDQQHAVGAGHVDHAGVCGYDINRHVAPRVSQVVGSEAIRDHQKIGRRPRLGRTTENGDPRRSQILQSQTGWIAVQKIAISPRDGVVERGLL